MNASNHPMPLIAAMYIVVVGMETFIIQPGFIDGLVTYRHLTTAQAGYLASAEMSGIALATIALALLTGRLRWRSIGKSACIVLVVADLASLIPAPTLIFGVIRFVAGLACGTLISWGYAAVGMSDKPDRNFGLLIAAVLLYSALGLFAMPVTYRAIGFDGVLVILGALPVLALLLVKHLPDRITAAQTSEDAGVARSGVRASCLAAVLAFFLAQGAIWAYLFLLGVAAGLAEQAVANALTISQIAAIAGALTVAWGARRLGHPALLLLAGAIGIAPLFVFARPMTAGTYAAAVIAFNFSANVLTPQLMAIVATLDPEGRTMTRAVALQMLGLAVGPALAALLIGNDDYRPALLLCGVLLTASLVFGLVPALKTVRAENTEAIAATSDKTI